MTHRICLLLAVLTIADAFVVPCRFPSQISIPNKGECSTTIRNLFFGTRREKKVDSSTKFSNEVIENLRSESLLLPYSFYSNDDDKLTVRFLQREDLATVVPMCVKEFGTPPEVSGFPWNNLNAKAISKWFDSIIFGPFVSLSLEMKIARRAQGYDDSLPDIAPDYNIICLEANGEVAAIVELSMQPLDPERNPPPVPLPLFLKQAYSESKGLPEPNGWVSNMLVDENCRGKGYSKLLMSAVEGIAKQWECTSISLHVDADSVTGKIPQRLYETLGYEPVVMDSVMHQFDWMEPDILRTGLYMVDGVPLVFLRKSLN
jgi:GNAT superfamily N-acetyltransferase